MIRNGELAKDVMIRTQVFIWAIVRALVCGYPEMWALHTSKDDWREAPSMLYLTHT